MNQFELRELSLNRERAESILEASFGFRHFYDEQWKAISRLLRGERILMIERTGFGKSLCYQFPASLFEGITVVFSPLIALMRDQVDGLRKLGISARCLNSEQTNDENEQTLKDALEGRVKILYIAPERQESQVWIDATRKMKLSMVVVDEAHTISVWGHDFRPSFRRIINLVRLLPKGMPVLATTATATKRVQADIEKQIGSDIITIRGNLMRTNFRLHVIETHSEDDKMIWIAKHLKDLPGFGLIYTGTRVETEKYSRWLEYVGIKSTSYNAGLDADTRKDIEKGLMENRWKCIVSTNALGMGIDKSDIRFIIHTQIPASPIHYYQEIGRAGRDGLPTNIVLFFNSAIDKTGIPTDCLLPKAFIETARPSRDKYLKVIDLLKEDILGIKEITVRANLKMTQAVVIKADLIEQGIIKEVKVSGRKKYEYQFGAPNLDTSSFERLRNSKLKDLEAMVNYVHTKNSRMEYLCRFLGDSSTGKFGGCDNTTEPKWTVDSDRYAQEKLDDFLNSYFPVLELEEKNNNIINGVAASYYGFSYVGSAIHRSKYEKGGDFSDYLFKLTLKAYNKTFADKKINLVMFVPPTVSGNLVENFAQRIALALRVPLSHSLRKVKTTKEQKVFQNSYAKKDNVAGVFEIVGADVTGMTVLVVDDICDSGATLKEIGRVLTKCGAAEIIPLVIAKTIGNDNLN